MFTVRRSIDIDAGHRVPYHNSKCKYLHGHRWKIVACVSAPELVPEDPDESDSGMVLDYGTIKTVLMDKIHDRFDHRMILWEKDPLLYYREGTGPTMPLLSTELLTNFDKVFGDASWLQQVPCIPTSEGLAEYWAGLIAPELSSAEFTLQSLEVWETPNGVATWVAPRIINIRLDLEK